MKPTIALSLLIIILATACTSPGPTQALTPTTQPIIFTPSVAPTNTIAPSATPQVRTEIVNFTTQDNVTLSGTLFGEGDFAVILAHMGMPGVDQRSWQTFARLLAERGFTALTFDFRGRGQSGGNLELNKLVYDVYAAIQFLTDRGFERIVCIGASMGGTACMRAALDRNLLGLGVIASVLSNGAPNETSEHELQQLTLPKVFAYGNYDMPKVVIDMQTMSELAPEPKLVQVYPQAAHGTDLFNTESGSQLTDLLVNFLEAIRSGSPLPTP